jgi:hypothetical protein
VPAEHLRIVGLFTGAAVLYGVLHDQVTARVCIEYFTVAHPRLVRSDSPALVGLLWGVLASAPAGAGAGALVAMAAREGPRPPLAWRDLVGPVAALAGAMTAIALLAGLAGYHLAAGGMVPMVGEYAHAVAPARHARFMADVYAHLAAYGAGLGGTLLVARRAQATRARPDR